MVSFQYIADNLISEGLLLTALELHCELTERGKGLVSLKEFFQESSNFDKFVRKLDDVPPSPSPSLVSTDERNVGSRRRVGSQVTYL